MWVMDCTWSQRRSQAEIFVTRMQTMSDSSTWIQNIFSKDFSYFFVNFDLFETTIEDEGTTFAGDISCSYTFSIGNQFFDPLYYQTQKSELFLK